MNGMFDEAITRAFPPAIRRIFEDQLCFGFVFGGFGKGYGGPGHDIDMFVAVNQLAASAQAEFVSWYMALHQELRLPPDLEYPGELVLLGDLERRIRFLEASHIRPVIESQYEYESILWVDALSEEKLAFVSGPGIDMEQLDQLMKRAYSLMLKWRSEVILWRPEPLSELKKLDLRRLFKGHVSYLKRQSLPPGA